MKRKTVIKIILVTVITILYLVLIYTAGSYVMKLVPPQMYGYTQAEVDEKVAANPQVIKSFEGNGYVVHICEDHTVKVTGRSIYDSTKRLYVESKEDEVYVHLGRPLAYDVIKVNYSTRTVSLQSGKIAFTHQISWGDAAFYLLLIAGLGLFNNLVLVDRKKQEQGEFE